MKNVKPGMRKDSLSTFIASRYEDGSALTHDELVSLATVVVLAVIPASMTRSRLGVDTTSIALTYISYHLAKYPEYREKLAKELSNYKEIDELRSIEHEKLPMLNAVIREVLRLYPPIPSAITIFQPA